MKLREYLSVQNTATLKNWLSILRIPSGGITRKEQMADALEHRLIHKLPDYLSLLSEPKSRLCLGKRLEPQEPVARQTFLLRTDDSPPTAPHTLSHRMQ